MNNPRPLSLNDSLAQFDQQGWDTLCRRMQVLLIAGRHDIACMLLNRFAARTGHAVKMDDHVATYLPPRVAEPLDKAGFRTFRMVHHATDQQLLAIENFGEKALEEMRETIRRVVYGEAIVFIEEGE